MQYEIFESDEAIRDVQNLAIYMLREFANRKAADDFLNEYDKMVNSLMIFPKGYRGISIEYRGYEIHLKPFGTYNIFFVVDETKKRVAVLRVLKDLQNWNYILRSETLYHFLA